ncbi:MAG: hypothetical protein FWE42_06950 [Defluviitaleaceae bacterium]|nr:hypothetical protein [Defluviitaleaceae bacterium]
MKTIFYSLLLLCVVMLSSCGRGHNAYYNPEPYTAACDYYNQDLAPTPYPTPSFDIIPEDEEVYISTQEMHNLRWTGLIQQFESNFTPQDEHSRMWAHDLQQFRNHIFANHAKFNIYPYLDLPQNIALGEAIDAAVISLLGEMPHLSEFQIHMEMQRVAAILRDNHFFAWQPWNETVLYPMEFRWLTDGFYLIASSEKHTDALSKRLVAINGVPVDEVFQIFNHFMSVESVYDARFRFAAYLRYPAVIQALGIYQDGTVYSFTDDICIYLNTNHEIEYDFGVTEIHSGNRSYQRIPIQLPTHSLLVEYTPLFMASPDTPGASIRWHTFIEETGILYIRIHRYFHDGIGLWERNGVLNSGWHTPDGSHARTFNRIVRDTLDENHVRAVVIDTRGNRGGYFDHQNLFRTLSESVEPGMLFHFFDEGSLSASLWAGEFLERLGAVSVGQPMGQATVFYYFYGGANPAWDRNLYYSRLNITVPNRVWAAHPDVLAANEDNIFRPHVLIPHSIDDWVSGHDPLMAYVVARVSQ